MAEQGELDTQEALIDESVSNIAAFIGEEKSVGEAYSAALILEALGLDISEWNGWNELPDDSKLILTESFLRVLGVNLNTLEPHRLRESFRDEYAEISYFGTNHSNIAIRQGTFPDGNVDFELVITS
ncbi:MAG: hypothetical protein NUV98_02040 [Candidatus Roizmanbacteria bacterium]|nr:hypothetical protein [Candidatus Roizmanbacteria bacterium]